MTVETIMKHEAGMAKLPVKIPVADLMTENIKNNSIGKVIEAAKPIYHTNGERQYHAMTRDWLSGELFRRVEPQKRTYGEYLAQYIRPEYGLDIIVGAKDEDLNQFQVGKMSSTFRVMKLLYTGPEKTYTSLDFKGAKGMMANIERINVEKKANGATDFQISQDYDVLHPADQKVKSLNDALKQKETWIGEIPSLNHITNARSLGKLAAFMANKGSLNGKQLISEETWELMHSNPTTNTPDDTIKWTFNKGGHAVLGMTDEILKSTKPFNHQMTIDLHKGREGFIGWMGYGGSVFNWNPEKKIGFGYVPFDLIEIDMINKRGAQIQEVLLACVNGTYQEPPEETGCQTCTTF